jgi:hypothetical protein
MVGGTWPPHARGNVRERKRDLGGNTIPPSAPQTIVSAFSSKRFSTHW